MHQLSKYVIRKEVYKLYVMMVVDDHSRLMQTELLTENGKEFGGNELKDKSGHPFERLLPEMGIKHRYTQFCRPQTNGKVERL